jgi:RNA-directed DNA polymerase
MGAGTRPRLLRVVRFLESNPAFTAAVSEGRCRFPAPAPIAAMVPAAGAPATWTLPPLTSTDALARWLNLTTGELEWFADVQLRNPKESESKLVHYRPRWQLKRDGSARLIEPPKLRLKLLQRRVLQGVLERIPPHEAAHGFRAGRSILSFVAPHVARRVVLRMDLRDFFPSITRARVVALFLTAGYPEPVALRLAGLCTTRTPAAVLAVRPGVQTAKQAFFQRKRYETPHLPQGAPTSPALANLAAHRLDCRLAGLAAAAGAAYTRYADDLVFSGGDSFARTVGRFRLRVSVIALDEGFEVHERKTRVMRPGVSQRAAGLVLNERVNLPRREFDALKAILHNSARFGPASQNREGREDFRAHLLGRIAHVARVHPGRGTKLQALFARLEWG